MYRCQDSIVLRVEIFGEAFDFAFAPFARVEILCGVTTTRSQGVVITLRPVKSAQAVGFDDTEVVHVKRVRVWVEQVLETP